MRRRDLTPGPNRAATDLGRAIAEARRDGATVPYGVKNMGTSGDATWTDPDTGTAHSVRDLPPAVAGVSERVQTAQDAADAAAAEAQSAQTTADGKNRILASATEPDHEGLAAGDQWLVLGDPSDATHVTGVKVWNGTAFGDLRMVADQILVPGSAGTVSIADGAVTAPKITASEGLLQKLLVRSIQASEIDTVDLVAQILTGQIFKTSGYDSGTGVLIDDDGIRAIDETGVVALSGSGFTAGSDGATNVRVLPSGQMSATGAILNGGVLQISDYGTVCQVASVDGFPGIQWYNEDNELQGRIQIPDSGFAGIALESGRASESDPVQRVNVGGEEVNLVSVDTATSEVLASVAVNKSGIVTVAGDTRIALVAPEITATPRVMTTGIVAAASGWTVSAQNHTVKLGIHNLIMTFTCSGWNRTLPAGGAFLVGIVAADHRPAVAGISEVKGLWGGIDGTPGLGTCAVGSANGEVVFVSAVDATVSTGGKLTCQLTWIE